ncbi:serine hydrolase domain-containing protein [Kribbella italica]|uniref:Beta-lactamase n=1 Tax=Kribbella italica TaxID=1540520 RepID=A0A7W9JDN3_9ACTN|nr:serine hydrolase domain-containing protein [Kribbella italica]MBB5840232.1 CubicO group peptidase (beta-lactamase class C family) [Kribbella italica]
MKLIAVLLAVALAAGGWLIRPGALHLAESSTGDAELQRFIDDNYEGPGHRLSVAVVEDTTTRYAGRGTDEHGSFEIGSISKALTGILLGEAVRRGEVKLDQQVGSLLPLDGSDVATVTLEELATHQSGLPNTTGKPLPAARAMLANLSAGNPYPFSVDQLLDQARSAGTDGRGKSTYSNLGGALLGQALAKQAGKSYPDLLQERVFQPLGMRESRTPTSDDGAAPEGYGSGGRRQGTWVQTGYAPAGGVVSTAADLAVLAKALISGKYVEALAPRRDFDEDRIGLFWITTPLPNDRSMIWHNGGTGGYRSFIGVDLERRRAVVVLSDVAADADDFATKLLEAS